MAEIKKIFKEAGMTDAKLTFVIVSKRIKTKFFNGNENSLSGKNPVVIILCSIANCILILRNGRGQHCHSAREV